VGGDDDVDLVGEMLGTDAARVIEQRDRDSGSARVPDELIILVEADRHELMAALDQEPKHLRPKPPGTDKSDLHGASLTTLLGGAILKVLRLRRAFCRGECGPVKPGCVAGRPADRARARNLA
jgi:hypothetical protein